MDDRYTVLDFVDCGSMAQVYRAHDESLDREVALKVLREAYASDKEFVERFTREAKCAACLEHPNIVSVYDRGRLADGSRYIAMEYVPGGSLADRIAEHGPLTVPEAAEIARQVASALEAAHARGIFHRDIKPHNILLTASGEVKVADFGIARAAAASSLSHTDRVLGTARYMSPGQSMGKPSGPLDDLYSLGVVLYEMLTGEVPFDAESPVALAHKHLSEPPRPPGELNTRVTGEVETVIMRLLSKAPEDRYASAAELAADLGRVRDGLGPAGSTTVGGRRRSRRRMRALLTLAPMAVLALIGALLPGLAHGPGKGGVIGSLEGRPGGSASGEDGSDGTLSGAHETIGQALLGPRQAVVPDVEELSGKEARQRLAERGLGSEIRSRHSTEEDAGKVLEQSAPAGTEARQGSRLLLAVGDSSIASSLTGPADSPGSTAGRSEQGSAQDTHESTVEEPVSSPPAASPAADRRGGFSGIRPPQNSSGSESQATEASVPGRLAITSGRHAAGGSDAGGSAEGPNAPESPEGSAGDDGASEVERTTSAQGSEPEPSVALPFAQGQWGTDPQGQRYSQPPASNLVQRPKQAQRSVGNHLPAAKTPAPSPAVEDAAGIIPPADIPAKNFEGNPEHQYAPVP